MLSAICPSSCASGTYKGHVVNVLDGTVADAEILVKDGIISAITLLSPSF